MKCRAKFLRDGRPVELSGEGNGPLAALVHGFGKAGVPRFEIANYSEHALGSGEGAAAAAHNKKAEHGGAVLRPSTAPWRVLRRPVKSFPAPDNFRIDLIVYAGNLTVLNSS